jgi:hypothetical protein
MFSLIGVLLTGDGVLNHTRSTVQVAGTAVNINLIWGVVLLVFGIAMLFGAMGGKKNPPSA